jgi:hypothetical protein
MNVLLAGDRVEMRRVTAAPITADVVKVFAIGNPADQFSVR